MTSRSYSQHGNNTINVKQSLPGRNLTRAAFTTTKARSRGTRKTLISYLNGLLHAFFKT